MGFAPKRSFTNKMHETNKFNASTKDLSKWDEVNSEVGSEGDEDRPIDGTRSNALQNGTFAKRGAMTKGLSMSASKSKSMRDQATEEDDESDFSDDPQDMTMLQTLLSIVGLHEPHHPGAHGGKSKAVMAMKYHRDVRNKTTTIDWQDKDDDKDLYPSKKGRTLDERMGRTLAAGEHAYIRNRMALKEAGMKRHVGLQSNGKNVCPIVKNYAKVHAEMMEELEKNKEKEEMENLRPARNLTEWLQFSLKADGSGRLVPKKALAFGYELAPWTGAVPVLRHKQHGVFVWPICIDLVPLYTFIEGGKSQSFSSAYTTLFHFTSIGGFERVVAPTLALDQQAYEYGEEMWDRLEEDIAKQEYRIDVRDAPPFSMPFLSAEPGAFDSGRTLTSAVFGQKVSQSATGKCGHCVAIRVPADHVVPGQGMWSAYTAVLIAPGQMSEESDGLSFDLGDLTGVSTRLQAWRQRLQEMRPKKVKTTVAETVLSMNLLEGLVDREDGRMARHLRDQGDERKDSKGNLIRELKADPVDQLYADIKACRQELSRIVRQLETMDFAIEEFKLEEERQQKLAEDPNYDPDLDDLEGEEEDPTARHSSKRSESSGSQSVTSPKVGKVAFNMMMSARSGGERSGLGSPSMKSPRSVMGSMVGSNLGSGAKDRPKPGEIDTFLETASGGDVLSVHSDLISEVSVASVHRRKKLSFLSTDPHRYQRLQAKHAKLEVQLSEMQERAQELEEEKMQQKKKRTFGGHIHYTRITLDDAVLSEEGSDDDEDSRKGDFEDGSHSARSSRSAQSHRSAQSSKSHQSQTSMSSKSSKSSKVSGISGISGGSDAFEQRIDKERKEKVLAMRRHMKAAGKGVNYKRRRSKKDRSTEFTEEVLETIAEVHEQYASMAGDIFREVFGGNYAGVEVWLDQGGNPNTYHPETGWTPLHMATSNGDPRMVKLLLDWGADAKMKSLGGGLSAIHFAVQKNTIDLAMLIMTRNETATKEVGADNTTALLMAIESSPPRIRDEMVRVLLEASSDPNHKRQDGWTPVSRAVQIGARLTIRYLVQNRGNMFDFCPDTGSPPITNWEAAARHPMLQQYVKVHLSSRDVHIIEKRFPGTGDPIKKTKKHKEEG